jgi:hypothetical protein
MVQVVVPRGYNMLKEPGNIYRFIDDMAVGMKVMAL